MHRSQGATALLGMPGFVVGAQLEVDGEWWLHMETTAEVVGGATCGTRAVGHGRRRVKVRDLPVAGRPVLVVWAKRTWRCPDADCAVGTWTERHVAIAARSVLTERARAQACRRVGEDEDSVAEVARWLGVGWHTVMAAVRDHGLPLVDDPSRLDGVDALGLDETRFGPPRRRTRRCSSPASSTAPRPAARRRPRALQCCRAFVAAGPSRVVAGRRRRGRPRSVPRLRHRAARAPRPRSSGHRSLPRRAPRQRRHRRRAPPGATDTLGHRGRRGDPLYGIRRTGCAAPSGSASGAGNVSCSASKTATPTARWAPPGWRRTSSPRLLGELTALGAPRARRVLRPLRQRRRPRARPARQDRPVLGDRDPRLPDHQRPHRSGQPAHREDPPSATGSATTTTTGSASYSAAASNGTLRLPPESEAVTHAPSRRATLADQVDGRAVRVGKDRPSHLEHR